MGGGRLSVEQWTMRVARRDGERTRQRLLREGLLDLDLKIRSEGDELLLPVISPVGEGERAQFEPREEREDLPRHELIGGIALLLDRDTQGAERVLASRPSLHTVLHPLTGVEGPYRTRRFEVLAGTPTTRTGYIEYGHRYIIDLGVAYFSPRLSAERQRIRQQVRSGERVLDMFAGVGPFSITLSDRASLVVAADINPAAVRLMHRNAMQNRCSNLLVTLADAARLPELLPWTFDRVIMNLPLGGAAFLGSAFRLCRPGGTIHFYILQSTPEEYRPVLDRFPVGAIQEREVRSYSPGMWHAVYDIEVRSATKRDTGAA